jgi:nitroreductase
MPSQIINKGEIKMNAIHLPELIKSLDELQFAEHVQTLMSSRQSVMPKRLFAPGPTQEQQDVLFRMAATAPDHGLIRPWRFVICPDNKRSQLGDAFAQSLLERDPEATEQQLEDARQKALRAPFLMLMVINARGMGTAIPLSERILSAGCAMQNIFLAAHAMGFGASPTSGVSMYMKPVRDFFKLHDAEDPLCFINIGTPDRSKPHKPRMNPDEFVTTLDAS